MLSLVMPTINRPDFVRRQLLYLDSLGLERGQLRLLIGDSSTGENERQVRELVDAFKDRLNVAYVPCQNKNVAKTSIELFRVVNTPYAAWVADDDFQIPAGMFAAVEFLKRNPDYSSASGHCLKFTIENSDVYGPMRTCKYQIQQPDEGGDSATERFLSYMGMHFTFEPLLGVHRIEVCREMFQAAYDVRQSRVAATLIPCSVSLLRGKAKLMDHLQLMRQKNANNIVSASHRDSFDWLMQEDWRSDVHGFKDIVIRMLCEEDGIDEERAAAVFRQGFLLRLSKILTRDAMKAAGLKRLIVESRWRSQVWHRENSPVPSPGIVSRVRNTLGAYLRRPGLWHDTFNYVLKPSSPYHEHFLPVHRVVTQGGSEEFGKNSSRMAATF